MKKIERSEILALGDYETVRDRFRRRIIEMKKNRRIAVGDHMTFIFENRDTVLFQIQEMLRVERITSEKGIAHEVETYNSMVPGKGELFATLMIEYEDREERQRMLRELAGLRNHLSLRIGDAKITGDIELLPGEEEDRLPAVNYVRFEVGDVAGALRDESQHATLEVDHPAYRATTDLPMATRKALADDLDEP
ncbi:MAG: DUF3501 family protein [Polyangiales bacterium]